MVVIHQAGKIRYEWIITFDGKDHVKLACSGCRDKHAIVGGVDETVKVDMGWDIPAGENDFLITRRNDGSVNVRWPDGWYLYR